MNKYFFFILISISLFLNACSESKTNDKLAEEEIENDNPIIGKWKLNSLQNKDLTESEVNIKNQPTEVILSIMEGGYFVIYDTFIDPKFSQKGFNRISETSKGQWELIDNKKLVLHHNSDDSTMVEEMDITKLNSKTLITKGKNKKSSIYKTYQGY